MGVVAQINPWDFPLSLAAAWKLAPALMLRGDEARFQ
jgi:acyl-CoA reductase-like NAD-dependent aldehyde dehydrogenase